jgi:hypothetical protein
MERLRKCLLDPARNCVRMILMANNAEKQDHGGGQAAETSERLQRFSRIFRLGGEFGRDR